VAEFEGPPHGHNTPPPHVHHAHEESFYIIEGETFTPRHYLGYFGELGQLYQAATPPSRQQLAEVMARYDTVVVA
jgi:hypothetical protein